MKRLFTILITVFLSSYSLALPEVDSAAVRRIVLAELAAMKLPANSPVCLAILPARNMSETGADPSSKLLGFLKREGMRPLGASTCYKPLPKGNVISIEVVKQSSDLVSAKVTFTDVTITPEKDLGTVRRRGLYLLQKRPKGEWAIKSYAGQ